MNEVSPCLPALVIGAMLTAGCAGLESTPQHVPSAAAPAEAIVSSEPRAESAATRPGPSPSLTVDGGGVASAAVARPAELARPGSTGGNLAKPAVPTPPAPAKLAASAPPMKTQQPVPPVVKPVVAPPLDLKSLETRLKETKAIGVFTKLALKNQIDDLLERFRALYQGRIKTSLVELRRSFDMLVMKTLALLQDADPPLAGALASSRESIWGILSDPTKFATL
jgi:hypothetical protein